MKNRGIIWGLALAGAGLLGGCTSTTRLASSGAIDDLYTTHNIEAIAAAEARRAEALARLEQQRAAAWDNVVKQYIDNAGQDGSYSENILSLDYEDSFERRLRGFESLSYKMPGSYYDYYYGDDYSRTQAYDPAFYNVIVMGDQVWVEPRYITSMFGSWGTPVNVNIGWGRNRWYRPYWDWYYGPSWGWGGWGYDPYWAWGGYYGSYYGGYYGWGYNPWYGGYYYPGYWGWGGHNHWGGGYWGGSWGGVREGRPVSTSVSSSLSGRRTSGGLGTVASSTPGRYNNSVGRSTSTSTSTSTSGTGARRSSTGGVNYQPGLSSTGSGVPTGTVGTGARRSTTGGSVSSSGSSSVAAPSMPGGSGVTYRRAGSSESGSSASSTSSGSSTTRRSTTNSSSGSVSRSTSPSYNSGSSSSSRSSGGSYSSGSSGSSGGGGGARSSSSSSSSGRR